MNHSTRTLCGLASVTMGLLAACGGSNAGQEPAVAGTGVMSSQRVDSSVVEKLSAARCDREQSCSNVGPGQKYASRNVCMDQMRGGLANDLNAYECPRGIDEARLSECMASVRSEECGHPFDTLSRIDKCRTGALCLK